MNGTRKFFGIRVDFRNNIRYRKLINANQGCVMSRFPPNIRELLLDSGKEQFLAHGFEKASLLKA